MRAESLRYHGHNPESPRLKPKISKKLAVWMSAVALAGGAAYEISQSGNEHTKPVMTEQHEPLPPNISDHNETIVTSPDQVNPPPEILYPEPK